MPLLPANTTILPDHVEVLSGEVELGFDGAHWYDISGTDHFWTQWRLNEALRFVDSIGIDRELPLQTLEVGGGIGTLRGQLEAHTAWTIDFTELDPGALLASDPGRGRTLHYDILERQAGMQDRYDIIILFDVLEHIENPAPFLDALYWHLRPGGHVFVNVPALRSAHSLYDDVVGHYRRYDERLLREHLSSDRVSVEGVRHWGLSLVPVAYARKLYLQMLGGRSTEEIVDAGFRPPHRSINSTFRGLMRIEARLGGSLPTGTSLLAAAKKR